MTYHYALWYAHHFSSEDGIQYLIQLLREGDTVITVGAAVLRQWYMQYHPASGPVRYASASDLEEALGEELRTVYRHFTSTQERRLASALQRRRKSVLVSHKTIRVWFQKYNVHVSYIGLHTAEDIENSCGIRYRQEVSDKGLGLSRFEMQSLLLSWGFEASHNVCQLWLEKYRMGIAGVHGTFAPAVCIRLVKPQIA